jgi:hypothetical protein
MSKANDGGPAFPLPSEVGIRHFNDPGAYPGLSLRDWFAGKAMQGELSAQSDTAGFYPSSSASKLAEMCYAMADAMIAERAKEKPNASA